MAGMQKTILMIAVVALVGCESVVPNSPEAAAAIELAIRKAAKKPTGKLTKADLEKVTSLEVSNRKITDLKPLAGLQNVGYLNLSWNQITDMRPLAGMEKLVISQYPTTKSPI